MLRLRGWILLAVAFAIGATGLAAQSGGKLTTDDLVEIQQLYARYNWTLDSGDSQGYAATFTPDGVVQQQRGARRDREVRRYLPRRSRIAREALEHEPDDHSVRGGRQRPGIPRARGLRDQTAVHLHVCGVRRRTREDRSGMAFQETRDQGRYGTCGRAQATALAPGAQVTPPGPLVVPARLGPRATRIHAAPDARLVLADVEEEPAARRARLHLTHRVRREQRDRRFDDPEPKRRGSVRFNGNPA